MSEGLTRDEALALMIAALASGEAREFHVGVVGYFLDGIPYSADGLAVSRDQTPNVIATHDGFACDGFFPVDTLEPIESPRATFNSSTGVEIAQVRVEVKSRDIWSVAEFVHGVQHDLFLDADVLIARKEAFVKEREMWLERPERSH
jgi:hypothetical protein